MGRLRVHKTYEEINERIRQGEAVVVTAEEIIDRVAEKGVQQTAREVDVVTTGTFAPMFPGVPMGWCGAQRGPLRWWGI
jgi:uncharacterized protein (DUF39 family)